LNKGQLFAAPGEGGSEIGEEAVEGVADADDWPQSELDGLEMKVEPADEQPFGEINGVVDLDAPNAAGEESDQPADEPESQPGDLPENEDEEVSDFLNQFR
jgi:hypothetical protein